LVIGFAVLIWMAIRAHEDAPPIPEKVVGPSGETIFTREEIVTGQEVFLRYGLMENGTVWGHGAYLGPDFSAEYLHTLAEDASAHLSKQNYHREWPDLTLTERAAITAEVQQLLKQNRYNPRTKTLTFTFPEVWSYRNQKTKWTEYFARPLLNRGLLINHINDSKEIEQLTAFFAWTAWASVTNRPGKTFSYTNNFPYDPAAGNRPSSDAILWSALSLITLLAGTAVVLFSFGKFSFLGWKGGGEHIHPQMTPGIVSESQRATIKYFVIVALLFLAQTLVGGPTAHYRADPGSFYGINLSSFFPGNIFRTWHLQLAIFWIATAYIAGGLFLAATLGGSQKAKRIGSTFSSPRWSSWPSAACWVRCLASTNALENSGSGSDTRAGNTSTWVVRGRSCWPSA
jgi:nitric oxide reductase subunit B